MRLRWGIQLLTVLVLAYTGYSLPPWAVYTGEERMVVHAGVYKPLLWSFRESDSHDDPTTPFENEGASRFDLREVVEARGFPTGVFASLNLFGVVEGRVAFEWFSFVYDHEALSFDGSQVSRRDYAIDLLAGFDVNRINPMQLSGFIYQLYPYAFLGVGFTDYEERISGENGTKEGNVVLDDVVHVNLGAGLRYGLAKLLNLGVELGMKARDFRTVRSPQPDGIAGEGYLRLQLSLAYGD